MLLSCFHEDLVFDELLSIQINPKDKTIPANSVLQLTATGSFASGKTMDMTDRVAWRATTSVVNIGNQVGADKGLVIPVKRGAVTIEAAQGEILAYLDLLVTYPNPEFSGEILITEIMQDPLALDDYRGEWLELLNTSGDTFSLLGCQLGDADNAQAYIIDDDVVVEPEDYLVFALHEDAFGSTSQRQADLIYDNFRLDNTGDELIISCRDKQIDWVQYDAGNTFPVVEGKSLSLNPLNLNADENNDGVNWCVSTSLYSADYGTPGAANDTCPKPDVISITLNPSELTIFDTADTQFSATVLGSDNTDVKWSLVEEVSGLLDDNGLFTAPSNAGVYHVRATSVADSTKTATATVKVLKVSLSMLPKTVSLQPGEEQQFVAQVAGVVNTDVVWSTSNGSISDSGLYLAPNEVGTYYVTAMSIADGRKTATAEIEVVDASSGVLFEFTDFEKGGDKFIINLSDAKKIEWAREIIRNNEPLSIMGKIVKVQADYNPAWSYHLDPATIEFFEIAVEVCDASARYVEDNLDAVGGGFLPGNIWCPWGSVLTREILSVDHR